MSGHEAMWLGLGISMVWAVAVIIGLIVVVVHLEAGK